MNSWKEEFYSHYSTIFGKEITANSYKDCVPYGKYIIQKCFPSDKNVKILDMGCGIGGFVKVCKEAGYHNISGVDVSTEDVAFAHQFGMQEVTEGELFETLSNSEDRTYDVVLYLDVIEHFDPDDILKIFNETFRILKPEGMLIVHVPNGEGIFGSRIRFSDFTHETAFTCKSLSQISRYAGFNSFNCYEDKPIIHSFVSFLRRFLWEAGTLPFRVLHAAETGLYSVKLSQNILFRAKKL